MIGVQLVDGEMLRSALPRSAARVCIETAFASDELPVAPPRTHLHPDGATLLLMPAWSTAYAGVKLVGVSPANVDAGLPLIHALYVLMDAASLRPLAIIDGDELTGRRTAAVSAFATEKLSRRDARHVVVFGAGTQAREHLDALREVRSIERVTIVSRGRARADDLVATARRWGLDAATGTPDHIAEADIVCTCTTSKTPLFDGKLVSPGTHLNAIGAFTPDARELDETTMRRARVFVESRDAAYREAGELVLAGATHRDDLVAGDLRDLARGTVVPRIDEDEITVFKSVGLAIEDLAIASEVYARVATRGG